MAISDSSVGRRSRLVTERNALEEAQRLHAGAAPLDQEGVDRIALGHAELAADHVVLGLGVADDVDALDKNARALLDAEGDIDGAAGDITLGHSLHAGGGLALRH